MMRDVTIPGSFKDLVDIEFLEIKISADGRDIWINNEERCIFRARNIQQIEIDDGRKK